MKKLLIISIIFILIILGGYLTYNFLTSDKCNSLSNLQSERDSCYKTLAKEKQDISLCGNIEFEGHVQECYLDLALLKGDSNICSRISKTQYPHYSDRCYKEIALSFGDSSLCSDILDENQRSDCYLDVALKIGAFSLCEKVDVKESCYGPLIEQNTEPSICFTLETRWKNECYYAVAVKNKNPSLCNHMDDPGEDNLNDCIADAS
jgi:hypothetical protein